jgi:hypothetical protein
VATGASTLAVAANLPACSSVIPALPHPVICQNLATEVCGLGPAFRNPRFMQFWDEAYVTY